MRGLIIGFLLLIILANLILGHHEQVEKVLSELRKFADSILGNTNHNSINNTPNSQNQNNNNNAHSPTIPITVKIPAPNKTPIFPILPIPTTPTIPVIPTTQTQNQTPTPITTVTTPTVSTTPAVSPHNNQTTQETVNKLLKPTPPVITPPKVTPPEIVTLRPPAPPHV